MISDIQALAKLVASYRKPNSQVSVSAALVAWRLKSTCSVQTILRNSAIPGYLCPLPFQKIRFLGGKLGETVAEEYQATTVGDLLLIYFLSHYELGYIDFTSSTGAYQQVRFQSAMFLLQLNHA
jgi:nucleotidyltransferase/DNA polymerase involved in DNA repair